MKKIIVKVHSQIPPELFICEVDGDWNLGTVAHAHSFIDKEEAMDAVNNLFENYPQLENQYTFLNMIPGEPKTEDDQLLTI